MTWVNVLVVAGAAGLLALRTRRILSRRPARRDELLRQYARWRFYHLVELFAVYAVALFYFGWGRVASFPLGDEARGSPPGVELLILSPFLLGLGLSWALFYDVEKALHHAHPAPVGGPSFWTRWEYMAFHVRQNLALVMVPVLLVIAVKHMPRLFSNAGEKSPKIGPVAAGLSGVIVLATMPWMLRLVLGLKRLPEGPLADRLHAAAGRLKFRCNGILLWNTRSGMANAMVVGVVPWIRYVVLTDRLIAEMTPEEVEAVFGHEVGHVKHHHMLYYMTFLAVSFIVVLAALDLLVSLASGARDLEAWLNLTSHRDLSLLPLVVLIGSYIVVVFGFVSRRCERQADVYGCRAVSCGHGNCEGHDDSVTFPAGGSGLCQTGIRTFISALEKAAALNGMSRDRPGWIRSWQHSTIARRVDFLQRVLDDRGVEKRFQRRVGVIKWVLFVGLGALLLLFTFVWNKQATEESARDQPDKHAMQWKAASPSTPMPQ